MIPLGFLTKLIKPGLSLLGIGTGAPDAPLTKLWRPLTMGVFVLLIIVSFFTPYELSDSLLTVIGLVMATYVGGRSYEKKAAKAVIEAIKDNEEAKREKDE